jgi:hypothetical protein
LKPRFTAIASRRVDLPVPFSPIRKVTGVPKASESDRIAGSIAA